MASLCCCQFLSLNSCSIHSPLLLIFLHLWQDSFIYTCSRDQLSETQQHNQVLHISDSSNRFTDLLKTNKIHHAKNSFCWREKYPCSWAYSTTNDWSLWPFTWNFTKKTNLKNWTNFTVKNCCRLKLVCKLETSLFYIATISNSFLMLYLKELQSS